MRGPTETIPDLPDLHADADADPPIEINADVLDIATRLRDTRMARGKRYIRLVRVSKLNGRDAKPEGFIAPEIQRSDTDRWAAAHGATIVGEYEELDVSGGKIDRAALDAALADVLAGKADGIIVAYLSRFARTMAGAMFVRKLQAKGKAFVSVAEGIEPEMLQTSMGWFTFTIMLAVAELQLAMLTEGFLSARQRHVAAGIANQVPYGYRKRKSDGENAAKDARARARRLEPDPTTARWVTFIFERRAAGDSWPSIARALDKADAPTPTGTPHWLWERVRSIVQNRAYLGELWSHSDDPTKGQFVNRKAHFPLVTVEQWDAANKLNQTSNRNGKANYSLTGIIRCATCGGRMVGFMQTIKSGKKRTGPPVKYRYYRCRRNYSWGRCPKPAYVPAQELEDLVKAEFFGRFCGDLDAAGESLDRQGELDAAQALIDERNAALDRFIDSPQTMRTAQRRGQAWYDGKVAELNDAVEAAEAEWQKIRNALTGLELPPGLEEDWETIGLEAQRGFLSDAFGVVAVKPFAGRSIPLADRVRIWARNEAGSPESRLPRRGATIDDKISAMVPIEF